MLEEYPADFNQAIIDRVACLIIVANRQGQIIRFNKTCEATTGYTFEEVKAHFFWEFLLVPEEISAVKAVFEELGTGRFPDTLENYWLTRQGERRLISWSNTALVDENNQIEYFIVTGNDITERKKLEEKLHEERDFAQLVLNTMGQGLTVVDEQSHFTYVNPAYARMVGYDNNQQLIGKSPFDLTPTADHTILKREWNNRKGGEVSSYETALLNKDGLNKIDILVTGVPYHKNGKWSGSISVISNITELKKAQELAYRNQELLQAVVEGTSDAVFVKDCEERFILVNQVFATITKKPVAEIIGRTAMDIWPSETARQFQEQDRIVLNTGLSQTSEFTVPISQDRVRTYLSTRDPYRDSQGTIIGLVGIARDITERKLTEEKLRESEERFRLLVEDIEDYAIFMLNPEGTIVSWNRGAEKIKGYSPREIIGQSIAKFYTPEDQSQGIPAKILATARTTGHYTGEGWRVRRDGSRFWASIVLTALYEEQSGQLRGFAKVTRDITERKIAEAALQESEARFSRLFHAAPMPIALSRLNDGVCLDINTNFTHLTGFSREEAIGRTGTELFRLSPDVRQRLIATIQTHGFAHNFEGEIYDKNGKAFEIITSSEVVEVNGEKCLLSTFFDISERKNAERQLKKWADIFQNINMGVIVADPTGHTMEMVNKALVRLLGYQQIAELVGQSPHIAYSPEFKSQLSERMQAATKQGYYVYDPVLVRKDGTSFPAQVTATMVRDSEGHLLYRIITVQDITERKRAEEQIKSALLEKEVLLKEIHHRVKNNLQVISSLLKLQASYLKDPVEREIFKESQNRVRTMALVHEKLYKSKDLTGINIGEYLRELVSNLSRLYATNDSKVKIELAIAQNLNMDLDIAIPCGLIVNELISNSLKHAFPDQVQKGFQGAVISLTLTVNKASVSLTVKDNGKGLPSDFDFQHSKSLGLKLVNILAKQLEGTIEVKSGSSLAEEGTEFVITFPFSPREVPTLLSQK